MIGPKLLTAILLCGLLSCEQPAQAASTSSLAALRRQLGPERTLGIIVWDPKPILKLPDFFPLAVRSGIDTVWICGYPFRALNRTQKQTILTAASDAGLKTIGFIDGDVGWPEQSEFVAYHYRDLTSQLSRLDLGRLHLAFATDIEVYAIPAKDRQAGRIWDGRLERYITLLKETVLPPIEAFSRQKRHPDGGFVVQGSLLTRFEPWWYQNGRRTEQGVTVSGLGPVERTEIAAMSYRNKVADLLQVSRIVRQRAAEDSVAFLFGVETIPAKEAGAPSFAGKEGTIGPVLLQVCDQFSLEDQKRLGGVFIHTRNPLIAYKILKTLELGGPEEPDSGLR